MTEAELVQALEKANTVYWETGENGLPESIYNKYMEELEVINPNHPLIHNITGPVINSEGKVEHKIPMLSLAKSYDIAGIKKWMSKVSRSDKEVFEVMPKYDGIAGRINTGKVLATRGNGILGEDISSKLPIVTFNGTYDPNTGFADGELLIKNSTFKKYFSAGSKYDGKYKNSRNAISGLLLSKENKIQDKVVDFVFYDTLLDCCIQSTVEDTINRIKLQMDDYPTDGIVIKLSDEEYAKTLGHNNHHWKHSIALKHANESALSVLEDVHFTCAKEHVGIVGLIKPVDIGGVTISRVFLHNLDILESLNLMIGDDIVIERAGDVIPHIVSATPGSNRKLINVDSCPACNSKVIRQKQFFVCTNIDCSGKAIRRIGAGSRHFGLKHIAGATISKLVDMGKIKHIAHFLQLTKSDFLSVEGFGEKSADNAVAELEKVFDREIYDYQLLSSLCIEGFGSTLSKQLLAVVTLDDLLGMTKDQIISMKIPNIGTERLTKLYEGLFTTQNIEIIEELKDILKYANTRGKTPELKKGYTYCFTGKLPEKRGFYEDIATQHGNTPVKAVNKDLDYLVMADPNSNSSKAKKARKLNINIISVDEFLNNNK